MCAHVSIVFRRVAVACYKWIRIAFRAMNGRAVSFAKPRRRFDQRVEHGLKIEGRAADHLQHVSGGGLLLERFTQIVRALAQLLEQPRVLDGDDSLTGKILDQLDVLLAEGTNLLAIKDNGAL